MIIVMGVMAASSLFVAAAFAAANGDLPLTRDSQDRKQAYAAAEAGINYYQYHLNQDPDYWTRCTNVPAAERDREPAGQPEVGHRHDRPAPLAQGRRDADAVHARADAGHGLHELRREQPEHDDRPGHGHVQDPLDGPPARGQQAQAQPGRVVPPPLVPRLPLLHRLRDHGPDQLRRRRPGVGAGQLRRPLSRRSANSSCTEIQFAPADEIKGPFHTNDDILDLRPADVRPQHAPTRSSSAARRPAGRSSAARLLRHPVFNGPRARRREVAHDAADQHDAADRRGDRRPRLPGQDHDPLQRLAREQHDGDQRAGQQRQRRRRVPCPANGVIYVRTAPAAAARCRPSNATYASRAPAATSTSAARTRRA